MATRTGGASFGITVILNERMFDVNDIADLDIIIGMNNLPHGTFTVLVHDLPDFKLESGKYGMFVYLNTGVPDRDGHGFKFYIRETSQKYMNEHTTKIRVEWEAGDEDLMKETTVAITGSSLDAMIEVLKDFGDKIKYENRITGDAANITDNMTWRLVNVNMKDKLNEIVHHSTMNADYMFWAYDDVTAKLIISSLNVGISTGNPQACIFTQDSLSSTDNSTVIDSNTGSQIWFFSMEERVNDRGNNLEKMFPNIIFSTVENGRGVVSNCRGECFNKIMVKYGAMSADDAKTQYGLQNEASVFGPVKIVEDFPMNVHKAYVIADDVRERILSEYGKKMTIGLFNTLGPAIGSRVYVRAIKPSSSNGTDAGDDMYYTDTYIVGAKKIVKRAYESGGVLGAQHNDMNPDYITNLVLLSKSVDMSNYAATRTELDKIATACGETIKEK